MTEWSYDGCPNDCGYCKKHEMPCVYTEEGKHRDLRCAKCGKAIAGDEAYQYKGFIFCEDCLDESITEVEELIAKANESIEARQIVKGVMPSGAASLDNKQNESIRKKFQPQLEIQGKESIYEKALREGKLL